MTDERRIQLGQKVRDRFSGAEGIAVARTDWLYGCERITVQPPGTKDGKPEELFTLDAPQCEIVEDTPAPVAAPRHGDRPDPARAPDPR